MSRNWIAARGGSRRDGDVIFASYGIRQIMPFLLLNTTSLAEEWHPWHVLHVDWRVLRVTPALE